MTHDTYVRGRQSDEWLKLSHDRKVSPRGTYQMSRRRWIASVPNSFGLPAGVSCPGRTPFCEACYGVNAEKADGVATLLHHNLTMLRNAGTVDAMTALLAEMVGRYHREADRVRLTGPDRVFRIHWDGDFFSVDYATAWVAVIRSHPDTTFWAYTRSFAPPVDVVPTLAGIDNLTLYLSTDEHNVDAARAVVDRHPDVMLAICTEDYDGARALGIGRRPIVCPENAGRVELMTDGVGACVTCRLCPDGRRDVLFSTSHRADASVPVVIRRTEPAESLPPNMRECANPPCHNTFPRRSGRGRERIYCSDPCRWAVYHGGKQRDGISRGPGIPGTPVPGPRIDHAMVRVGELPQAIPHTQATDRLLRRRAALMARVRQIDAVLARHGIPGIPGADDDVMDDEPESMGRVGFKRRYRRYSEAEKRNAIRYADAIGNDAKAERELGLGNGCVHLWRTQGYAALADVEDQMLVDEFEASPTPPKGWDRDLPITLVEVGT